MEGKDSALAHHAWNVTFINHAGKVFGLMVDDLDLRVLTVRLAALRQAMEAVMQGNTPDSAKWVAADSFMKRYCELARRYVELSGDTSIKIYDVTKIKSWADTLWPQQKQMFDIVYADVLTLSSILEVSEQTPIGPIYNLFVSGIKNAWIGEPFQIEIARCIREYTENRITGLFGSLTPKAISGLKSAPCIFAYEAGLRLPPKFGYIRDIVQRQGQVRVSYDIQPLDPFITENDLDDMKFELDISKNELYRTHWAVKEIDLARELKSRGIILPTSSKDVSNLVDVSTHVFDVALSFPGEIRLIVEKIALELEGRLGPNRYFYDNNYTAQLARPSLDILLQGIYTRAKLDVVFLSSDYQKKDWCGIEFRAVREIMMRRENQRIMFIRTDNGPVDGVFKTDGYIDANRFNPAQIADFIHERLKLLPP